MSVSVDAPDNANKCALKLHHAKPKLFSVYACTTAHARNYYVMRNGHAFGGVRVYVFSRRSEDFAKDIRIL